MRRNAWGIAVLFLVLASTAAWSQELILDDSLRGGSQGVVGGGSFGPDGWTVTNKNDFVYWHIPTVSQGACEFSVRGLVANDARPEGYDKNEIFHMYDWTYNSADTVYDGYRNGPYKHYVRKTNLADPGKANSMEMLLKIASDETEPDTSALSWDPGQSYRFREEWGPDGGGRCVFRVYRDGALIMTMSALGSWNPAGHAVRIAGSPRAPLYPDFGAPLGAVFSDLKVWRTSGTVAPPPSGGGVPHLGLSGDRFTINGQPAFLLGASYFDAIDWRVSDLDGLASRRFNLIRIWCDWGTGANPSGNPAKSLLDSSGNLVHRQTLVDLVHAAAARGIVVDVTICAPEGLAQTADARTNAVRNVVSALAGEPNVYFDVMNEHSHPAGPASTADVARFVSAGHAAWSGAILTVSDGYLSDTTVDTGHVNADFSTGIQLMSPHMDRTADWATKTGARVLSLKGYLTSIGRPIPVMLDEEARRNYSTFNPSREDFFEAAREARDSGAAGWVFHSGASFDLAASSLFGSYDSVETEVANGLADVVFGPGAGPASLSSGWEDGQPLGNQDRVLYSKDVAGFFNSMSPAPECSRRTGEVEHTGAYALMIAGFSNAGYAYCYYDLFDVHIPIQAGTKLRYWIWHQSTSKVALDGRFTDGSTIRDGGFVDELGVSIHPGRRQEALGVWIYVEVDLSAAAGKTLDTVMVGFDNGSDGFTGSYRAYIDDVSIGAGPGQAPPLGRVIALQSMANSLFVCADNAGASPLIANRSAVGPWESFLVVDQGNGNVALRSLANNLFVCADNAGASPLIANRSAAGPWETFQWIDLGNGQAALRSLANSLSVCADRSGKSPLIANRTAIGPWETFTISIH